MWAPLLEVLMIRDELWLQVAFARRIICHVFEFARCTELSAIIEWLWKWFDLQTWSVNWNCSPTSVCATYLLVVLSWWGTYEASLCLRMLVAILIRIMMRSIKGRILKAISTQWHFLIDNLLSLKCYESASTIIVLVFLPRKMLKFLINSGIFGNRNIIDHLPFAK